jgi:hypothetical protein
MLVGWSFLFVRPFPALQIPNLKTTAPPDQCDLAFEFRFFAKLLRQNEAALSIRRGMLRARMQLSQKHAAITRGYVGTVFRGRTHSRELLRRHDEEELVVRFRQKNEFFTLVTPPARGNGDAIFLVDEVAKFTGIEELSWSWRRRRHAGVENRSILTHFSPLLTTFRAKRQ